MDDTAVYDTVVLLLNNVQLYDEDQTSPSESVLSVSCGSGS
jgi:hypothetical protein